MKPQTDVTETGGRILIGRAIWGSAPKHRGQPERGHQVHASQRKLPCSIIYRLPAHCFSRSKSITPTPQARYFYPTDFPFTLQPHLSPPTVCIRLVSMSVRPVLKGFLALTPTSPKSQSPPMSNEVFTPAREHRGSASSDSSVTSDVGENGFLVLTPAEKAAVEVGLGKIIEEEAVE